MVSDTSKRASRGRSTGGGAPAPANIRAGRIIDVDPLRWTCVIRTEGSPDNTVTFHDVPLGGPYLHPLNGEGIYAMPEIGALVQVCRPSEGDAPPFIVAYRPYPSRNVVTSTSGNKPTAAGNRPRFSPGDMGMVGRDQNGIFVRRGQLTEIFGGPLARTLYQGRTGTIHSLAQTVKLDVFGGSARWEVDRPEADPDGHQGTRLDLKMKEYADDRSYVARLEVGGGLTTTTEGTADGGTGESGPAPASTEVVDTPVLRLRVYVDGDKEESDLAVASSICFDKSGQVEVATKGTVVVEIRGDKTVTLKMNPDGTVTLDADTSVVTTAAGLPVTHTGAKVKVGEGTAPTLFDRGFSTDASAAWAEVSALAKVLGMPTVNIDKHIAALSAATYTAAKLETD